MFQGQVRIHDNDPEDDSFEEYTDIQLLDMIAFLTTQDDAKVEQGARFVPPRPTRVAARAMPRQPSKQRGLRISDITQTVAQMALKPGVTKEDAIEAMLSRAVELNLKLVGRQNVSKELEARGVETPYLTILQFCNPMDARVMVMSNPVFSSYMPCRISLVEDGDGKAWLMMLNLDMLIDSELLPTEVMDTAIKVNQQMLDIMVAGATGEYLVFRCRFPDSTSFHPGYILSHISGGSGIVLCRRNGRGGHQSHLVAVFQSREGLRELLVHDHLEAAVPEQIGLLLFFPPQPCHQRLHIGHRIGYPYLLGFPAQLLCQVGEVEQPDAARRAGGFIPAFDTHCCHPIQIVLPVFLPFLAQFVKGVP